MDENRVSRISEFLDKLPESSKLDGNQAIIFTADMAYGGSTKNAQDCTNTTYDSCHKSTNGGDCINYSGYCDDSTNRGACENLKIKPPSGDLAS